MGRKLDLSGLSDLEAAHVLQVVQRDMRLRKREEERLCELKQELDEEGSRCHLLSRQSCFNLRCCIRCCAPFTFLLNPKRPCGDCGYNVCRGCRVYNWKSKSWLCTSCQKHRLLKAQSLEWFYTNVKRRFKRFGSAKVLKTLYKKHLTEHSILSELTDGSGYEESGCNDGSVCDSDSTFYRQSEEHSLSETLSVARRVAEEAIDEAISKAEVDVYCQEKQNEAHYLREHRGELIEELAKTIVQKIIVRRKTLAEIKCEYGQDLVHAYYDHFVPSQQTGLWRSHSLSLLDTDSPSRTKSPLHSLKQKAGGPSLSAWKSVDRLDSSVLQSPDGNWLALQSSPMSRPRLLTKRKSLVYSALELESGAVSAYEAMDSDSDLRTEPDSSWGAVLKEIHKKLTSSDLLEDLDLDYVGGRRGSADLEGNFWKSNKALLNKKVPVEMRKPSSSRRTSIIDVNFNVEEGTGEEEASAESEERRVRRARRKRRSRRETSALHQPDHNDNDTPHFSDAATPDTLTSGAVTPDLCGDMAEPGTSQINQELAVKLQTLLGQGNISDSSTNAQNSGDYMDVEDADLDRSEEAEFDNDAKERLYKLVAQSRLLYLSSTDDDLDKADEEEEEEEEEEDAEPRENLQVKLCRLEQEVRSSQFSSTEDELDRVGRDEEEADAGLWRLQAQRGEHVRDLAGLVSICQFSSTEDELDRVGQDEISQNQANGADSDRRESIGDLDVNMFELRDQEDLTTGNYLEMSKAGDFEAGSDYDRRESIGDLDVTMFELKDKEVNDLEQEPTERAGEMASPESKSDSEEDEAEFNRIINSMLMMTLEDMQNLEETQEEVKDVNNTVAVERQTGEDPNVEESGAAAGGEESGLVGSRDAESEQSSGADGQELKPGMNTAEDWLEKPCDIPDDAGGTRTMEDEQEQSDMELGRNLEQTPGSQEGLLSLEEIQKRHSAESLRSITTEVLKVLNATEQLLRDTQGQGAPPLTPNTDHRRLDQQLCRIEEHVYVAAGSVYGLEAELDDLEECSRAVSSSTSHSELRFLEEQVATAAAKVHQSEIQVCDISARIAALRSAGLNVDPQPTVTKPRPAPAKSMTLDGSKQQRRLLPAPPTKDAKET